MPISGLVLVCGEKSDEVARALHGDDHVTIGPREATGRIPIVLETETDRAHREHLKRLREIDGVLHVELAYVDYRSAEGADVLADVEGSRKRC